MPWEFFSSAPPIPLLKIYALKIQWDTHFQRVVFFFGCAFFEEPPRKTTPGTQIDYSRFELIS